MSNPIGAFTDPNVSGSAYFNPLESQAVPHMMQQHCHGGSVPGAAFPTAQHPMHSAHPVSSAGFAQGMPALYKPSPEPLYSAQVPFQSYIPGPGISSDIFTQSLPLEDNSWSHGSSHSCSLPAASNPQQSVSGSASMPTLSSMGHGSLLHGPHGSFQGHSSSLSNPGSMAHPNASFPPPGLTHCSVPRPPPQAPWPHMQTRISAGGTVTSANTGFASDIRNGSGLQQHTAPTSPTLPPGFQYAGKGSRQLMVHFTIASNVEVANVNNYMSGITSQLDGIESCTPIPVPNHTVAVSSTDHLVCRGTHIALEELV